MRRIIDEERTWSPKTKMSTWHDRHIIDWKNKTCVRVCQINDFRA